jgi:hypothetical protein
MSEPMRNGNSKEAGISPRVADRSWTEIIEEEPIACLAIAAAAGFILGGGMKRSGGLTILTMLGQIVLREAYGDSSLGALVEEATGK